MLSLKITPRYVKELKRQIAFMKKIQKEKKYSFEFLIDISKHIMELERELNEIENYLAGGITG